MCRKNIRQYFGLFIQIFLKNLISNSCIYPDLCAFLGSGCLLFQYNLPKFILYLLHVYFLIFLTYIFPKNKNVGKLRQKVLKFLGLYSPKKTCFLMTFQNIFFTFIFMSLHKEEVYDKILNRFRDLIIEKVSLNVTKLLN